MTVLVTGGAGFIGTNFVIDWLKQHEETVVNIDKLTYSGNLRNLSSLQGDDRHIFIQGDIGNKELIGQILTEHRPRAIINLAAESHVDRSICDPEVFIQTNIVNTFQFLEIVKSYWSELPKEDKANFRFLHISTDEVYGSLELYAQAFTENSQYKPNNPYSASKASSDHLVRAYHYTYGLPVLTTHCSNNYGPYQFPEKLIPLVIHNALAHKSLPIYGDGLQIRDWLYVGDHCSAMRQVLEIGQPGEVYNIGGQNEISNIEIVYTLCDILDELRTLDASASIVSYRDLITFVKDRPGHDRRYAINTTKIKTELGLNPAETFNTGIRKTVRWYLDNQTWVAKTVHGDYRQWLERQYE